MFPMLFAFACSGASDSGASSDAGADVEEDTPLVLPPEEELNGRYPTQSISAPEFRAVTDDGAARDREDLLGEPSVVWFFPAAGTAD